MSSTGMDEDGEYPCERNALVVVAAATSSTIVQYVDIMVYPAINKTLDGTERYSILKCCTEQKIQLRWLWSENRD